MRYILSYIFLLSILIGYLFPISVKAESRFCQYGMICLSTIERQLSSQKFQIDLWVETYQSLPLWVRLGPPTSQGKQRDYYDRHQKRAPSQIIWKRISDPGRRRLTTITLSEIPQANWQFSFHPYIPRSHHRPQKPYRLPYPSGQAYKVTQGYHGSFSHDKPTEYALDFALPTGTPILAARDGIVLFYKEKWYPATSLEAGKGKGNFIWIQHADGSVATYAHLQQNWQQSRLLTKILRRGSHVTAGDIIGVSGNTGYSTGAHLHFHVSTSQSRGNYALRTHKTLFDIGQKQPSYLKQGFAYRAP